MALRDRRAPRWRRASLIDALRTIWLIMVFWCELGTFYASTGRCRWPDTSFQGVDSQNPPTRILIVADPQVLDKNSYPGRAKWLTSLTLFIVDLNLRKNWKAATRLRPQIVIFLGDMMDGGRYAKLPEEYAAYYARFTAIFKPNPSVLTYYIPGNHDVGLGSNQAFSSRARDRYEAHFGALNQVLEVSNHSLVLIDAPGLAEEDYRRHAAETEFDKWLPTARGSIEFVQSIAQSALIEPTILFSHIPLARPERVYCGPQREKGTIHRGAGAGYQNLLGRETTQFLLESVRPSLIFSGDDHDYCEYTHPFYTSSSQLGVKEVTVKSFSMAMGIRRPGFQLLSLASYPATPLHGETMCVLPDQLRIYTHTYLPLFILSILALIYVDIFAARRGPVRAPDFTVDLHSPVDKPEPGDWSLPHSRTTTGSTSGTSSPRMKYATKRPSTPGSPSLNVPLAADMDGEVFPLPHMSHPVVIPYPGGGMPSPELLDSYDDLPAPAASSRKPLRRSNGRNLWSLASTAMGGDPLYWRALLARFQSLLNGRRRRVKEENVNSPLLKVFYDTWRTAWPPLLLGLVIWAYLIWT